MISDIQQMATVSAYLMPAKYWYLQKTVAKLGETTATNEKDFERDTYFGFRREHKIKTHYMPTS